MMCGGTAPSQPADEETQKVIEMVKSDVETKLKKNLATFKAVEVARQMVQGFNYFVKVDIGEDKYIHLRIYQNLPCYGSKTELNGIKTNMDKDEKVGYFEGFEV